MIEIDKKDCLKALGRLFRERRTERGMTQTEVAEQSGILQERYSLIENGKRDTEFVTVVKVCQVLHVNLDEFIKEYLQK